ncbi:hypothetical protein CIW48_24580 [Methylobacterium sp. P1-11]|uniref:hypothetical protein n=1 Tax=Methylobacterium sp. P1-11 TaxID=2024616 RepID=UPI0011EBD7D3|nr:hypothetical protein [Methylobacterium sp. P1-11]KAA0121249.1 hypothetical protein CIW48_24580 [Methylobacterium sp. P1-11]
MLDAEVRDPAELSGTMLAEQLIHFAGADAAGIPLGARVSTILTSRADSPQLYAATCALAQLLAHRAGTP